MVFDLHATMNRVIRQDIQDMHAYAVQPSAGLVKLDTMENPYRLPQALQQALGARLAAVAINRYPGERNEDLKAALARFAQMPGDCALMLGNGSDELISLLSLALDRPGAVFMAPLPGFVMYGMSAALQGVRFLGVNLDAQFELDVPAMLAAIEHEKPALLYLAYPNNPTGNLWRTEAIESCIQAMTRVGGLVVMDEAYQPFASRDSMSWLKRHPHVLLMRTLSKFGLAGVRIGYLMGRRELIGELDKLRPPFNVSVLNAEAALFALEHAEEYARQAAAIRQARDELQKQLAALPGVTPFPSQANMILTRVPDAARAFTGMKDRGVLVKNVSALHPLLAQCLRLTVGTPPENERMLDALRQSL